MHADRANQAARTPAGRGRTGANRERATGPAVGVSYTMCFTIQAKPDPDPYHVPELVSVYNSCTLRGGCFGWNHLEWSHRPGFPPSCRPFVLDVQATLPHA